MNTTQKEAISCYQFKDQLPTFEDFIALVEDEKKETVNNPSGYTVYHKYNKGT